MEKKIKKDNYWLFSDLKTENKSLNVEPIVPEIVPNTNPPKKVIDKTIPTDTAIDVSAVLNMLPNLGI